MTHEGGIATVGLVVHPSKPVDSSIATLLGWARGGGRVVAREQDRDRMPAGVEIVSAERFAAEVGGVVALGGDGTMLGAMRLVIERPVPVLGVNHGNLGFLVEVTPVELPAALAQLAAGEFTVESPGCLAAEADGAELTTRFGHGCVRTPRRWYDSRPGRTPAGAGSS